jgi:AcrR family transcriptional regulator
LDAAEAALAERGVSVPMEDIAQRAGVGVGTIYRQFATKEQLVEAIVVARYERLADEAAALAAAEDVGAAFFGLFGRMVDEATVKKTFADTLARAGVDIKEATSGVGQRLVDSFEKLLTAAQAAGIVRDDVGIPGVMAVLTGACLAAEHAAWDRDQRAQALTILFDGLRAASTGRT